MLIHFPEVLSLSDSFEQHALFPDMKPSDVINEFCSHLFSPPALDQPAAYFPLQRRWFA